MTKKKPVSTKAVIKVKTGRPTKYKQEYCQGLLDFFNKEEVKIGEDKNGKPVMRASFPTYAGYAAKIDVDNDTLFEWARVHSEFSAAYKKAKSIQEQRLVQGAMNGFFNPVFSIFFAKNNLGYKDKPEPVDEQEELKKEHSKKLYEAIKKAL